MAIRSVLSFCIRQARLCLGKLFKARSAYGSVWEVYLDNANNEKHWKWFWQALVFVLVAGTIYWISSGSVHYIKETPFGYEVEDTQDKQTETLRKVSQAAVTNEDGEVNQSNSESSNSENGESKQEDNVSIRATVFEIYRYISTALLFVFGVIFSAHQSNKHRSAEAYYKKCASNLLALDKTIGILEKNDERILRILAAIAFIQMTDPEVELTRKERQVNLKKGAKKKIYKMLGKLIAELPRPSR